MKLLILISILVCSASVFARPNIIIIFADDLGYGDLSCYGHPSLATPHLDQMADEGQRWTDFYVAAPVCSPSRAGLLTGRLPARIGVANGVFFEYSAKGLPEEEVTLAEVLIQSGYKTGIVGKWHLGHRQGFLPTNHGFDSYYGIPYSNDMRVDSEMPVSDTVVFREGMTLEKMRDTSTKKGWWVPLMEDEMVVEYPTDQTTLTRRYTKRVLDFIETNKDEPFFLYYAQSFPHIPLFASDEFLDTSKRGLYGDVVEELDDSVGQILDQLRKTGLDENTLVIFTSDNGPWLSQYEKGGSAGLLRAGKGTTFEGGQRVPAIFWMPGRIQPAVVRELGSSLDFFTTIANLANAPLLEDRISDSLDLAGVLFEGKPSPRESFYYYRGSNLYAIRMGPWKAHFTIEGAYRQFEERTVCDPPLLYHLGHDPGEKYNLASDHPDVVKRMMELYDRHTSEVTIAPNLYQYKIESQVRLKRVK